jgi:uncharacterized repeat protein (TIGR03809 family)
MSERQDPHVTARIAQLPPTMVRATRRWDAVSLKWRDLAERRKAHFVELYETGRWKHYYTDTEFLGELRKAVDVANRWATIVRTAEARRAAADESAHEPQDALSPAA